MHAMLVTLKCNNRINSYLKTPIKKSQLIMKPVLFDSDHYNNIITYMFSVYQL